MSASAAAAKDRTREDRQQHAAMHSRPAAVARLLLFLAWTLLVVPPYALILAIGPRSVPLCRRIARGYWRVAARVLGLQLVVRGRPSPVRPTLFVANHASYLDIVVLGSLLDAAFVAKSEVGTWPGIGFLARLGRTVFVDRRPGSSRVQRDNMVERLKGLGESLILFPEGTSNDGNRVLPFKSALLSVAQAVAQGEAQGLPVQPVSVAYTRLDGLPIGRIWRAFYAWYGDMELAPHLWFVLGLGRVRVEVDFHEPVSLAQFSSRKTLTDHCCGVIRHAVIEANHGRVPRLGGAPSRPAAPAPDGPAAASLEPEPPVAVE